MILEAIVSAFVAVITFLIGLIPSWSAPGWLTTATTTLADAVGHIAMLNGWLPVSAIGQVVVFLMAAGALALGIRLTRIVLSLVTGGGGSAA